MGAAPGLPALGLGQPTAYAQGEVAQCNFWFPPVTVPVGFGHEWTSAAAGADDGLGVLAVAVSGAGAVAARGSSSRGPRIEGRCAHRPGRPSALDAVDPAEILDTLGWEGLALLADRDDLLGPLELSVRRLM